jgi:hypothetical protein
MAKGKLLEYSMTRADLSTAWPRMAMADCESQPWMCMPRISCILPFCVDQHAPSEPPCASWRREPRILAWKRLLAEALGRCLGAEVMRRRCVYTGAEPDEDDDDVLMSPGAPRRARAR